MQVVPSTAELSRNNARLAAIVESSEDAIFAKTLAGFITDWNKSAEKMYGYSVGEIIGKHVSMLAPQEKKPEITDLLEKIRQGKHIEHFETKRVRKDGTIIDVSISVSPVRDTTDEILGAAVIARDITSIHKMQAQILEENEKLKKTFEFLIGRELKMSELKSEIATLKKQLDMK